MTTYTEEEARTKWCPHVRLILAGATGMAAVNRIQDPTKIENNVSNVGTCITSACMAWRWVNAPGPRPHNAPEEIYKGYCGLAGGVK